VSAASRGLSLKTEDRAARRAEWEKWKREKDQKAADEKKECQRQEDEARKTEMKLQRQSTVHHARPVPRFIRQKHKSGESTAE